MTLHLDQAAHLASAERIDVVIVGAGLSGSLAAILLGRAGYRVVLLDLHQDARPDFRVEKIAGDQVATLQRLGLMEPVARASTVVPEVLDASKGRLVARHKGAQYSLSYRDLVNVARRALPPNVDFRVARAIDVQAGPETQSVTLEDGRTVCARVAILATGQADTLRQRLGIGRRVLSPNHTLVFGFDLVPQGGSGFRHRGLTYYGERREDCVDYLALLQMGPVLRANLFTFCDQTSPWVRPFRADPTRELDRLLPGLGRVLGPFDVVGKVQMFMMSLVEATGYRRPGVVLVGDAFRTSCPASGRGVSRLLVDVERLCTVHLPRWLSSPGMGEDKVAQFYDDPVKRRSDADALKLGLYRRSVTLRPTLTWKLRRQLMLLKRTVRAWIDPRRRLPRTGYSAAGSSFS